MDSQRKTVSLNMILSIISQIVTLFTGLIVQRYILVAFGSSYNGLTSLVSQIISYLVLLESGIGAASMQAFYHPLNEGDWHSISGIMNATAKSYRQIGYMFTGLLIGAALIVPLMALGEVDFVIAALITLISGGGNIVSYMIGAKYGAFLTADCKTYVKYAISIIFTLLSAVLRIIALQSGCGIVLVQFLNLVCIFFNSISTWIYVRRRYPKLDSAVPPNMKAISKRWNVLIHNLAGLVVTHTDILILSIADTLKHVSVYSIYNQLSTNIGYVLQNTFQYSLQGNLGRMLDNDKEKFEKVYAVFETIFTIILFVVATLILLLIRPFVMLYTSGITDVEYVDFWLPILFVGIFLFNYIRIPAFVTYTAAGMFRETQTGAIIEMLINLSVSLTLFFFTDLGLYGLLLGTIASFCFRTTEILIFIYCRILKRSKWKVIRLYVVNVITFIAFFIILYVIWPIYTVSYIEWILTGIILSIITAVAFLLTNLLFNFRDTKNALLFIKSKFLKRY